ncbi:MAG: methyltransferase domain-containing protein [Isosphaeraceae bacterium]
MDQPGLDVADHRQALDALRRINQFSAGARALWPWVRGFCQDRRNQGDPTPVRLLDVATGGGDLPVQLWKKAQRQGLPLEVAGCDKSALAVEYAQSHAQNARAEATFFTHDVVADPLPTGYDVVTSSLFLHHLDEPEALEVLRALGNAGELVLVDDLRRGAVGWALAYVGVRVLSRSRVAHVDGPLSVEGAFTPAEARALAVRAGWVDVEVRSRWPCRFVLIGRRA